jgi:predicted AlkP superfamily phosphohydrolase/phosphomutase
VVEPGRWTGWLPLALPVGEATRHGHVRFKVLELDAPNHRLRLYQSQVHDDAGFTRPAELAGELAAAAGPFVEWTESYDRLQGWIDDATQLEIYEQHVQWMSAAAAHLLRNHRWDLFLTQIHFLDMAYHVYWGTVDPRHPGYAGESGEAGYWSLLARAHALADDFLGRVVEAAGEDAVVVVLGDHGQDVYHTNFLVNSYLAREGFLSLARDRRTGRVRIDWSASVAYAQGHRVFLNVAGREPSGIVPAERYSEVADAVADSLARACDPRTGLRAVSLVLRGEDARSWGLYGPGAADLVVATAPGFQAKSVLKVPADAWVGLRLRTDRLPSFRPTRLFRDFTGEHDSSLPLTRALRTLFFAAGPGIRAARRDVPMRLVDVAPTLAGLLGVPPPRDSEGSSLVPAMSRAGGGPC